MKIIALRNGRWADIAPHLPQITLTAGETIEVSDTLAAQMIEAGAAKAAAEDRKTDPVSKHVERKVERSPVKRDKKLAEG